MHSSEVVILLYIKHSFDIQSMISQPRHSSNPVTFCPFCAQLSHWLVQAVRPLNASTLPPPALAALRGLLAQLGASFLQSLPSPQLLDLLTQPDLPSYSPAQVRSLLNQYNRSTY